MTLSMPLQSVVEVYTSPADLFRRLRDRRNLGWLALILIFLMHLSSNIIFFDAIDPDWIVRKQIDAAGELEDAEREELTRIFRRFAEYSGISGGIISTVMTLIMSISLSGYYMLVGNSTENRIDFNDWFVFSVWSQLPILFKYLGFLLLFFVTPEYDIQLDMMGYSSVNQVFLGLDHSSPLYSWAESLDLFYLWQVLIAAIGLSVWCKYSYSKSFLFASIPYFVVFGGWLLIL